MGFITKKEAAIRSRWLLLFYTVYSAKTRPHL